MTRGSVANWQKWSGNRAKLEHFIASFFSYFPLLFCCFMGSQGFCHRSIVYAGLFDDVPSPAKSLKECMSVTSLSVFNGSGEKASFVKTMCNIV